MNLKKKLDALKEGFKATAPFAAQEIMHHATEDLKNSGIMDRAAKVGEKAPDFNLKNTGDKEVNLYALLEKGPIVLTFYRGKW